MDSNVVIFSEFNSPPVQLSVPNIATSSLFLLSALPTGSKAVIPFFSAISLIPSWQWFFALTPFEAIFLGFIIAQVRSLYPDFSIVLLSDSFEFSHSLVDLHIECFWSPASQFKSMVSWGSSGTEKA